jgi:hypothetical protein
MAMTRILDTPITTSTCVAVSPLPRSSIPSINLFSSICLHMFPKIRRLLLTFLAFSNVHGQRPRVDLPAQLLTPVIPCAGYRWLGSVIRTALTFRKRHVPTSIGTRIRPWDV